MQHVARHGMCVKYRLPVTGNDKKDYQGDGRENIDLGGNSLGEEDSAQVSGT